MIGAALGARSAPGADYCFDQRVSRGVALVRLRSARGWESCRVAAFRARGSSERSVFRRRRRCGQACLLSPAPLGVSWRSNPQPVSQTVKCSARAVSQARTETSAGPGIVGCIVDRREAGEVDRALDFGPAAAYPACGHRDRRGRVTAGGDQCSASSPSEDSISGRRPRANARHPSMACWTSSPNPFNAALASVSPRSWKLSAATASRIRSPVRRC